MPKIETHQLPPPRETLYLIDISSFIFRAFYAIKSLKNKKGEPTNAVYGVATMLARLAEEAKPEYLAVVYDSREPSFRKKIYAEYKANRTAAPDDLVPQFAFIEELIRAFQIHSYRQSGIEADDLIATLTHRWCHASSKHQVIIVSSDKDLMQLVSPRVHIWDTMSNKLYGSKEVEEKLGVKPDQVRDYLALVGDSSDNIPGVAGIGPKGAADLLRDYSNLEKILAAAEKEKIPGKKGETLRQSVEIARLSAELATIERDLKLDLPFEALQFRFHLTPAGIALFEKLDFQTLITRWKAAEGRPVEAVEIKADSRFRTLLSESDLSEFLKDATQKGELAIHLEGRSNHPGEFEILGLAMSCDSHSAVYLPWFSSSQKEKGSLSVDKILKRLKPILEDSEIKKIGYNLKMLWNAFSRHEIFPQGFWGDTRVAAYLLDPDGRHNLESLAQVHMDYTPLTEEQVLGSGRKSIGFGELDLEKATRYAGEQAWVILRLWKKLWPLLKEAELKSVYSEIDLPLVTVLAKMERQGVRIDTEWLKKLSGEFEKELKEIEERVQAYASSPVNLNSPKQLAQLLFQELGLPPQGKTKTGLSTDAQVLEALSPVHEVPRLLLEYREIAKLKGTYVDPLPELMSAQTGKIHTSFHQTIAATGRLSSTDPNLQNIPIRTDRGFKIRRAFIPSVGNLLVSADYSQIELRILAHMSGDKELIRSFQKDEDVHRRTASEIYEISPDEVDDNQRGVAKAINFGLMYGKTAFGLSQELKISRKEATEMIQRYFEKYKGVKKFLNSQIEGARETGYVRSLCGRRRKLADILSKNAVLRNYSERMAMNTPIQGTAADLMKIAMIEIDRELMKGQFEAHLIIQVHDEVLLDCPKDEVEAVTQMVGSVMENAMKMAVPLKVNLASGKNWMAL